MEMEELKSLRQKIIMEVKNDEEQKKLKFEETLKPKIDKIIGKLDNK